jgi:hypothetical protein
MLQVMAVLMTVFLTTSCRENLLDLSRITDLEFPHHRKYYKYLPSPQTFVSRPNSVTVKDLSDIFFCTRRNAKVALFFLKFAFIFTTKSIVTNMSKRQQRCS